MKEYAIKIAEVLEKTVQVKAEFRKKTQMKRYEERFHQAEVLAKVGKNTMVLPIPEEQVKQSMAKNESGKILRFLSDHEL